MSDPLERAKELAGRRAAQAVEDGMRVGLGTGSTVHHTILALGERRPRITCAATSDRTADCRLTRRGLQHVAPAAKIVEPGRVLRRRNRRRTRPPATGIRV